MLKFKVLIAICVVIGSGCATIASDLDDDNFRKLKDRELDNELGEDQKLFWGTDNGLLPYETLAELDALEANPPFPAITSDEADEENEIERKKREDKMSLLSALKPKRKNKNKMDEKIRDTPEENSKFHGSFVLNDLEN